MFSDVQDPPRFLSEMPSDNPTAQRRPLRVCYVISAIDSEHAGTEGHLLRLIRNLDRRLIEPHLVVLQRSSWTDQFDDPRVPLTVLGFRSFRRPTDWLCSARLTTLLRELKIDVVELHFTDAHFLGSFAAWRAGVPAIVTSRRDLGHQLDRKQRWMHRIGNLFAHQFLANSHEVVNYFSRLERVPEIRFEVIYNGIDLQQFDSQLDAALADDWARRLADRDWIVQVANLRPVKNHSALFEAAGRVLKHHPRAGLLLLGAGSEESRLRVLAEELGISDRVLWAGSVAAVGPYLKRAAIGCLTSRSEGFSNALIEYMAAGLPVVATATGGAMEAVLPGVTGHLVPVDDIHALATALSDLLSHPDRASTWGHRGRLRVEQWYTMTAQLEQYYLLYARLVPQLTPSGTWDD